MTDRPFSIPTRLENTTRVSLRKQKNRMNGCQEEGNIFGLSVRYTENLRSDWLV